MKKRKILSLFLSLCLLIGLLPTVALAADQVASESGVRITEAGYDGTNNILTINVDIKIPNSSGIKTVGSIISYDSSKLTLIDGDGDTYTPASPAIDADPAIQVKLIDTAKKAYSTDSGVKLYGDTSRAGLFVGLGSTKGPSDKQKTTDWLTIYQLRFKVSGNAADILNSDSLRIADPAKDNDVIKGAYPANNKFVISVDSGDSIGYKYGKMKDYTGGEVSGNNYVMNSANVTATYPGSDKTPPKPAYSGTQAAAPTAASNSGGKIVLTAQSITGETVEYAKSAVGTTNAPTDGWQTSTEFSGLTVGTAYTFWARVKATDGHAAGTAAKAEITAQAAALTSISISGDATANVPTKGNTTTVTLAATGNYDGGTTGDITAAAAWTVDPAYAGVSVDKGIVTIQPSAVAGGVTIKAEYNGKSNTHKITLSKAAATLTKLTISGNDSVSVPGEYTYTASGEDQYGESISTGSITWGIDGSAPGVSIGSSDGKLKVENTASVGSVTIKAVSGSIPATKTVTITKAAPAVETVTIGGGVATLTVPAVDAIGGSKSENASTAFTAELKDQYGATISGTVTWSVSGNPGVTISDTGLLSITNKATGSNVTVKAECGSKSATQPVSVTKAPSVATFVQVSKSGSAVTTDTIIIPTSGNTTADYTAKVYDQYGAKMDSESVNWSIEAGSTGATQSSGVVTVPSTATAGTVKLTATSSTKSTLKAEVTITLSNKPAHNIGTFADANKTITYGDAITGQTVESSTGTVKYSSNDSTVVSVDETTGALTVHKAGNVTITAKVEEDATHAETSATYTITVNTKELEITGLTATDRDYAAGDTSVTLTGGALTGVVGADDVSVTMPTTGTISDANAGSGKAVTVTTPTLSGADKDNYTLKAISGITVNINKIDPDVGTVSGPSSTIYTSTALTGITLSKTGTASGTLELTAGQTLTAGTSDYNWTFTPGDTTNYNTLTGTVSLTVAEDALSGIAASGTPSKTSYKYGETFETNGLTVTATYASGASKTLSSSEYTVTNGTMTMGQTEVTLSYQGQTCTVSGLTVSKADAPTLSKVAVSQRYTVTTGEKALGNAGMPANAGTLTYTKGSKSKTGSVTVSSWAVDTNGKVTYTLSSGAAGDTVTLPVTISSTNYGDATVNVVITLTNKDDQTALTLTGGTTVVYGQTLQLGTSGGSGTGAVTYTVTPGTGNATIDNATGKLTPVKVGTVKVKATKAEDANYNAITSAEVEITITKATPTGTPDYTKVTTSGKTLADANLTVGTITPAGTISWNAGNAQSVAANTAYDWTFRPTDTVNYNNLTGSITPYTVSHSGGGGGGSYTPSYSITVDKTENGTITVSPKSASKGDTVTITVKPDKGYELDTLKVLDKNGDKVKLTEKNGKYTFTMPTGKVTVKGSFVEETPVQIFKDVPVDAYYYEAVKWAAEKGITGGVGNGLFAPNQPCTRAQIVTFLWRAAGSPAPKNMSSFTDVPADAFYAKAVAWAVENGITGGTGDGKFSPDDTCTRAQSVTFLYRAAGSPAVSGNSAFTDVAADAYYAAAVKWAEKNGITGGIGGGLFGSNNNCTRAQIVTFLYRSVK